MEYRKAVALRIEPEDVRDPSRRSDFSMDGERIPYLPTTLRALRGLLRVVSR